MTVTLIAPSGVTGGAVATAFGSFIIDPVTLLVAVTDPRALPALIGAGFTVRTGYAGSFPTSSCSNNLVAKAGGGQSAGTPVTTVINRYTTVATVGDSSTLPVAQGGMQITITNAGASGMNVFPNNGDSINGAGANAAFSLPVGKTASFNSAGPLTWHAVLGA